MQDSPPPGNALIEYILPIAIVGVILVVGLITMQPTMHQAILSQVSSSPENLKDQQAKIKKMGENPALSNLIITLDDGTQLKIPAYPSDLSLAVETEGVNGTTDLLADNLRNFAKQLLDANQITPEEYANFEALANQGHHLAQLQKLMTNATLRGDTDIHTQKHLVDGVAYSLLEIGDLISDGGSPKSQIQPEWLERVFDDTPIDPLTGNPGNVTGKELNQFKKLYTEACRSKAMANPQLKKVITALSLDIRKISTEVGGHSNQVLQNLAPISTFETRLASAITHEKSATICTSGGPQAQDSGIQCKSN